MNSALTWLNNAFARTRGKRVALAYARLFGAQAGGPDKALVLEDLCRYCGLRQSGFVPGQPDQTAFNEGQRDVLLHLLSLSAIPPEDLLEAFDEGSSSYNQ